MRAATGLVQYALRRLRRTPTFTIAATLTLAIAIGATTTVFGLVDGVLLARFPFPEPDHVLHVLENNPTSQLPVLPVSAADYLDWRAQSTAFSAIAALDFGAVTVTGNQEPERLVRDAVTPNYFTVFATPMLGRALSADSGGQPEAVISHRYWQRHFGGAPSALGKTLIANDTSYVIVGVLPASMPVQADLWTRLSFNGPSATDRRNRPLDVYGRLAPGVTPEQGLRELKTIAARLAIAYPETNTGWSVVTNSLLEDVFGSVRPALLLMLAAAACVLLIGTANLANLFLVRCLARERETAVRTALGATRADIVRELSVEAGILGLGAGTLGIGIAVAGIPILRDLTPSWVPRLNQVGVDARVVAFCALISIVTVIIVGVTPAWQTSRGNVAGLLKEGGRGTASRQQHAVQDGLVVLQVAVALVLLTGAGLLVESFARAERVPLGMQPDGVLTAQIALPDQRFATTALRAAFATRVVERLAAEPGITSASASSSVPGQGGGFITCDIVGRPADPLHRPLAMPTWVTPSYLRTLRMTLRRGRFLSATDDDRAVQVAVVDEHFVRRYLAGADPIGSRIAIRGRDTAEIVGVVAPVKQGLLAETDPPELYFSLAQSRPPGDFAAVALRTSGDPLREAGVLTQAMMQTDPTVPVFDIETITERLNASIETTRFATFLSSLFAGVAFVLGVLGIYSVLAYVVAQRRRDIAVRIALGASQARVMRHVLRRALGMAGAGIALGSGAAWLLTRVLAGVFFGVNAHDPIIFGGAVGLFGVVAVAAASIPAFRAARVDPVVALTSS
jgi:putative ABC transport system permease protein